MIGTDATDSRFAAGESATGAAYPVVDMLTQLGFAPTQEELEMEEAIYRLAIPRPKAITRSG